VAEHERKQLMRFLLTAPWPVGSGGGVHCDLTVPVGTIIDGTDPQWQGTPLPFVMPVTAQALDEDAWDALCAWHPNQLNLLPAKGC
jgi:hypothetical protein